MCTTPKIRTRRSLSVAVTSCAPGVEGAKQKPDNVTFCFVFSISYAAASNPSRVTCSFVLACDPRRRSGEGIVSGMLNESDSVRDPGPGRLATSTCRVVWASAVAHRLLRRFRAAPQAEKRPQPSRRVSSKDNDGRFSDLLAVPLSSLCHL